MKKNERNDATSGGAPLEEFVIARAFDAPRALVWKAWTETDRLMQWFGPRGFTMRAAKNDPRPGGVFHYCLRTPNGDDMWGKWIYREIAPPERLVFVSSFSDPDGGLTRHPHAPEWPAQMLTTVLLEEREGKTTVTIRWIPIDASAAERKVFDAGRASMTGGWTGTFDQLAEHLAKGNS